MTIEEIITRQVTKVVTAEKILQLGRTGTLIICTMAEEVIRKLQKRKIPARQRSLPTIAEKVISYVMHNEELQRALDQAYRRNEH